MKMRWIFMACSCIKKLVAKVVCGYQFVNDVLYYWQRGHFFRDAVNMAHKVLK